MIYCIYNPAITHECRVYTRTGYISGGMEKFPSKIAYSQEFIGWAPKQTYEGGSSPRNISALKLNSTAAPSAAARFNPYNTSWGFWDRDIWHSPVHPLGQTRGDFFISYNNYKIKNHGCGFLFYNFSICTNCQCVPYQMSIQCSLGLRE